MYVDENYQGICHLWNGWLFWNERSLRTVRTCPTSNIFWRIVFWKALALRMLETYKFKEQRLVACQFMVLLWTGVLLNKRVANWQATRNSRNEKVENQKEAAQYKMSIDRKPHERLRDAGNILTYEGWNFPKMKQLYTRLKNLVHNFTVNSNRVWVQDEISVFMMNGLLFSSWVRKKVI